MGLQTFLGPILAGTQKNNNPAVITSNTPSATFLQSGTSNSYRNTGAGDCFQFVSVPQSALTVSTATLSAGFNYVPYNTVQGVNYPLVFPAGSYIDNVDFIVNSAFTLTGTTPLVTIAINLISAPGSTYAAGQTVASTILQTAGGGLPTIGVYATGNTGTWASASSQTNPITYSTSGTTITANGLAMIQNTGTSDAIMSLNIIGTGTTPAITAGSFSFAFNYVVRNPDGSWYPQTPPNPYTNTVATY